MRITSPNQKKENEKLQKRLDKHTGSVRELEDGLCKDMGHLVSSIDVPSGKPFKISDHKTYKSMFGRIKENFSSAIVEATRSGQSVEWKNSNVVQDSFADKALKLLKISKGDKEAKACYLKNEDVLRAFQKRKVDGMILSENIWKQTGEMMNELECCVTAALKDGKLNEVELTRKLQKYLHDYDSMQKVYKEATGKWADCKNMDWRILRLVRNEINMAYRLAQLTRWRQMPFVTGMTIKTSQDSHEKEDMCDALQGDYPLWLEWYGWHVNCKCYAKPIIGEKKIEELPDSFNDWVFYNKEKIRQSISRGTEYKFITDNKKTILDVIDNNFQVPDNLAGIAKERGMELYCYSKNLSKAYKRSVISNLDIFRLDDTIERMCKKNGIDIEKKSVRFSDDNATISYFGRKPGSKGTFEMSRVFYRDGGKIIANHAYFDVPKDAQGKGISKEITKTLLRFYEWMGVDTVTISAERDGSYVWSKFGFSTSKSVARRLVDNALRLKNITQGEYDVVQSLNILDGTGDINMKLLSRFSFSEKMLKGQSWGGYISLKDRYAMTILNNYLYTK